MNIKKCNHTVINIINLFLLILTVSIGTYFFFILNKRINNKVDNDRAICLESKIDELNKDINSDVYKIRFYKLADSVITLGQTSKLSTENRLLFIKYMWEYGNMYGVSPVILLSVAKSESGFDPYVTNIYSGASGIFQFLPSTFFMCASSLHEDLNGCDRGIIFDIELQTKYAAFYIRKLYDDIGNMPLALSRYNMGHTNEVNIYARNVLFTKEKFDIAIKADAL